MVFLSTPPAAGQVSVNSLLFGGTGSASSRRARKYRTNQRHVASSLRKCGLLQHAGHSLAQHIAMSPAVQINAGGVQSAIGLYRLAQCWELTRKQVALSNTPRLHRVLCLDQGVRVLESFKYSDPLIGRLRSMALMLRLANSQK